MSEVEEDQDDNSFELTGDILQDYAKYLNKITKANKNNNKNKVVKTDINSFSKGQPLSDATPETVAKCFRCDAIINLNISGSKCWRCGSEKLDKTIGHQILKNYSNSIETTSLNKIENIQESDVIYCQNCRTKITTKISGNKCWKCGRIN